MRFSSALCLSAAFGLLGPASALAEDAPEGVLIEAEDLDGADTYANVIDVAEASGGKAVTSTEDWH
ncbi:MAG: hypothetical protein AAF593_07865, partial [Planctomycetota bacterium]